MPFFGKNRKRSASAANCSTAHLPQAPSIETPHSSPPPYQFFPDPILQQQQPYPQQSPYSYPQPSSASLALRPSHSGPPQQNRPWTQPVQKWASTTNLPTVTSCPIINRSYTSGKALYDFIGDKFSDVVSLIDEEGFTGGGRELIIILDPATLPSQQHAQPAIRGGVGKDRALWPSREKIRPTEKEKQQVYSQERSINVISKISLYANSRLPPNLPPLRVFTASWPLICMAAHYSNNAYKKPVGHEKDTFVKSDLRLGTKAMVLKSVPLDDRNTIVFAIRGTSLLSLRDWGVNMSTKPVTPVGFLDDPGNLCHEGFLRVARNMVQPIAARLRHLLQENPSRASCSLLITGHSAGGAVAALLYAHMLSEAKETQSELNILTGCFKRIHCITFGAPPVTLLPLWKPANSERRLRKSLFLSFINEGDVVARAEKLYIMSIIELLASPTPDALKNAMKAGTASLRNSQRPTKAIWKVPPATLSNAGRLVVLRVKNNEPERAVTASIVTDQELRQVVFGDPLIHGMEVYARRIEALATRAVLNGE